MMYNWQFQATAESFTCSRYRLDFIYRYIDDVLSINNPSFAEFLPLINPLELEIKETTDTASSTSFLTIVINSVLKFMINGMTSILKSYIFQICAVIYQLMVFASRN